MAAPTWLRQSWISQTYALSRQVCESMWYRNLTRLETKMTLIWPPSTWSHFTWLHFEHLIATSDSSQLQMTSSVQMDKWTIELAWTLSIASDMYSVMTFFLICASFPTWKVWWRGVVGSVFRLKRSYSTPGPVSTAMGDCLRAGKPSRCEACQLGRLSLLPSMGW